MRHEFVAPNKVNPIASKNLKLLTKFLKNAVARGQSLCVRFSLGLPERKIIAARSVACGFEDPAVNTLVNSTRMARRSSTPVLLPLAALRRRKGQQTARNKAPLKSGDVSCCVLLARPPMTGVASGHLWRAQGHLRTCRWPECVFPDPG